MFDFIEIDYHGPRMKLKVGDVVKIKGVDHPPYNNMQVIYIDPRVSNSIYCSYVFQDKHVDRFFDVKELELWKK